MVGDREPSRAQVPDEARFWSEEDLEAFFRSNGHLAYGNSS